MTDYPIYTRKEQTEQDVSGLKSTHYENVPTGQCVSDAVAIVLDSLIPGAEHVAIFDKPYYLGGIYIIEHDLDFDFDPDSGQYWFVHYSLSVNIYKVGSGTVIVIHRETGAVIYMGSDCME